MRNWQTLTLSLILAAIVAYGINDWRSHRNGGFDDDSIEAAAVASRNRGGAQVRPSVSPEPSKPSTPPPSTPAAPSVANNAAMTETQVRERFGRALNELGTCLGVKVLPPGSSAEPTLENWMETIKADLGEPVLQTEDWSTVDITTPSGERRRIRVEMDYSGADRIVRRVKYTRLSGGEDGTVIPLTNEQSEDPSETFLASLESDGRVDSREKAQRIYFGGGEEIVVTEKNGRIADITMNRAGRGFHCNPSDPSPESCKCQTMSDEYAPPSAQPEDE